MIKIDIKVDEGVMLPHYESELASGFDLMAKSFKKLFKGTKEVPLDTKLQKSIKEGYLTLRGFERVLIGTGVYVSVPQGYEIQIRSRSGYSLKRGIIVANSPGTIDADYRGEIGVILLNNTPFLNKIVLGDRIAQGVVTKVQHALWNMVETLDSTDRGDGGFGSTDSCACIPNDYTPNLIGQQCPICIKTINLSTLLESTFTKDTPDDEDFKFENSEPEGTNL